METLNYEAPFIEIIEVQIEKGFVESMNEEKDLDW